jgi:radical SAM protein with 4Fe4S-binding SPASM domain
MYDNISRYTEADIEYVLGNVLGKKYLSYREKWQLASLNNIPSFPIHIDFELNDTCNQSCVMCPRNTTQHPDINYEINKGTTLAYSDYQEMINEGADKGLLSVNLGAFAEPLIHDDVFDMIAYAHEQGIVDSRLITNGLLLGKHFDAIFDSGLVNLFVSIDAFTEKKYREIRGHGFKKVTRQLLEFLEEKERRQSLLPIVRVSFVDMDINDEEKSEFLKFWRGKVDIIDIQVFDDFNIDVTKKFNQNKPKKWDCTSPWVRLSVLSDGSILPCCNFFGRNIPVGNIKEITLEEAWNSIALRHVREGILNDNLPNCSICQRTGG